MFQGQEHQDETGWDQFKWRNSDPALGRFFNVDPLSEDYYYNSPYAFSENKVTAHVELEGLESFFAADGSIIHGPESNKAIKQKGLTRIDNQHNSGLNSALKTLRNTNSTLSVIAGATVRLSNSLNLPKERTGASWKKSYMGSDKAASIRPGRVLDNQGNRTSLKVKRVHLLKENSIKASLREGASTLGRSVTILEGGFLAYDLANAINAASESPIMENEETGTFLKNASGFGLGLYVPSSAGIMLLYDLTMAREGEYIYSRVAAGAREEYFKYRHSDSDRAEAALKKYYKNGGKGCLNCSPSNVRIGPGRHR